MNTSKKREHKYIVLEKREKKKGTKGYVLHGYKKERKRGRKKERKKRGTSNTNKLACYAPGVTKYMA